MLSTAQRDSTIPPLFRGLLPFRTIPDPYQPLLGDVTLSLIQFVLPFTLNRGLWLLHMAADHSAVDSTLGYAFQTLQALIILLQANDDESVSIELTDDVTLHQTPSANGSAESRFQVAHSTSQSLPAVTLKSVKLWKTIGIWASEYAPNERYFLLTCAPVSADLKCLTTVGDRTAILVKFEEEAALVIKERQQGIHEHKERISGCRAFLALAPALRAELLNQILLCASIPNINAFDDILDKQLRPTARPDKRLLMISRIREYWMNRACLSLTGKLSRRITKGELQQRIEEISSTISGSGLPDDYGTLQPPTGAPVPDTMRRQIELVNGGNHRINRAKTAHWKSRNQRQKWLDDDVSMMARLNDLDQKLIDAWNDRHGPMCDDTATCSEAEKQQHGCSLLDWSHHEASQWPISIGRGPVPVYVTQGTYQDLANRLEVGWHPEYKVRLSPPGESK
jgi:hypothetical protein